MKSWIPFAFVGLTTACSSSTSGTEPSADAGADASGGSAGTSSGGSAGSAMEGGPTGDVQLPGTASGAFYDDLTFSTESRRMVVAPSGSNDVDLVDPDTLAIVELTGFGDVTPSGDAGGGWVFA